MNQALLFLADAVLGFFTGLFLLRFYMQILRVSFVGPLGQFVVSLTNWAVKPLRRVIPGFYGLDLASFLVAFLLQAGLIAISFALFPRLPMADTGTLALVLCWAALLGLIRLSIHLLIGALIIQAVLSWVSPYSPLAGPVNQFTRPFLAPIRRILPPIGGIDLSPLVAILLAQVVLILL